MPPPKITASDVRGVAPPAILDADLRHVMVVIYAVSLAAALPVILLASWPGAHRLVLLACLGVGLACIPVIHVAPLHRLPRLVYVFFPLSGLFIIACAMAVTGGWTSPFSVEIGLAIGFTSLLLSWRHTLPIVALGSLVAASPALYMRGGNPLLMLLVAAPAYAAQAYAIRVMMDRVQERTHTATLATLAREQTEQRARGLITLQRVSTIVAAHLSMDDAISAIVAELGQAFGHRLVSVYLREGQNLVMQAQAGYTTPYPLIPLGVGICGRVGATGETIYLPDVRLDPAYRRAVDDVISEVCVPLRHGEQVAGILNVESVDKTLTELDREVLELFALQVSVVLNNARAAGELRQRADQDALTGLLNHRALMEGLDRVLAVPEPRCAVLMLDINDFKLFNDSYGHLAGDAILSQVAATLSAVCRQGDLAGRYGGDEFALVLPGAMPEVAERIAARLAQAARDRPFIAPGGAMIPLVISVGVAVAPADGCTRRELLAVADAAMYRAKGALTSSPTSLLDHVAGDLLGATPFGMLLGLVTAVDGKDHYTAVHSADVTRLALMLADALGLSESERRTLSVAGALHDVGKIGVPDAILRKPGRLTVDEMAAIRRHVEVGAAIVRGVFDDPDVLMAIAEHHERWDGDGYPYALRGDETSLPGRIMQVADAASAMRLDRPYRAGLPDAEVVARLRAGAGTQFDPTLVEPFIAAYLRGVAERVA